MLLTSMYGYRKITPGKSPSRKVPTHQTPPWKITPWRISTRKIPTWNFPAHFINCLSSLNISPIHGGESVYVDPPPWPKILISPERLRVSP